MVNSKKMLLFTVKWRNRVEQLLVNKFQQKVHSRLVMAVSYLKTTTKNTKSTDKIVSPNSSFLLPKFAVSSIAAVLLFSSRHFASLP
jgi:hypothetical protein